MKILNFFMFSSSPLYPSSTLHCGHSCTFIIDYSGNIYSFGSNKNYKIGHDDNSKNYSFSQINSLKNIKMVCCYDNPSFIDFDGNVYTLGKNECGRLGIGKSYNEMKYTKVPVKIYIPPVQQISCGYYFIVCLTYNGHIYSFGKNDGGQLGIGSNDHSFNSPQLLSSIEEVDFIECGGDFTICRKLNEEYYAWGNGTSGQLSQNNYKSSSTPLQCINFPDNIVSIRCGYRHILLLDNNGKVYAFGGNTDGQLGLPISTTQILLIPTLVKHLPEIQRIECGYNHNMLIDINNNLWLFGASYYGQLGFGNTLPVEEPKKHQTLENIIDISYGGNDTFVKTSNNEIFAMGYNDCVQIGIESTNEQIVPIQVLKDKEDNWSLCVRKSRAKSARK